MRYLAFINSLRCARIGALVVDQRKLCRRYLLISRIMRGSYHVGNSTWHNRKSLSENWVHRSRPYCWLRVIGDKVTQEPHPRFIVFPCQCNNDCHLICCKPLCNFIANLLHFFPFHLSHDIFMALVLDFCNSYDVSQIITSTPYCWTS